MSVSYVFITNLLTSYNSIIYKDFVLANLHLLPTSTSCQPPSLANLHLLPTSTSCQPPPLANLHLLPTSTSCQPPPLANPHPLPTSTSSQYPSLLNPRALTRALAREGAAGLFCITLEDFPYFQTPFILPPPPP